MNGWFSRCAVAKDLTLAQHFISCERTQHELITSAVGSKPQFAASATKVCYGWIGSRTNTIFLRPRSATYTKHIRLGSRLRRLRPPATNLTTTLSIPYTPPSGGCLRWRFGAGSTLETAAITSR
ncbi:MAG: hypothetical protein ACJAWC_002427 [Yoonia sp.]|jgi:hypothetical protein